MPESPQDNRSLFRPDALRRYSAGSDEAIVLPFTRPRLFGSLWCLLGLLVVVAGLLGAAMVTNHAGALPTPNESSLLLPSTE